jgi:hypothetical protein
MRPKEQSQQDSDNYWHAVDEVAERIVDELNDAENHDNDLHRVLHENIDQHDYVIGDDLQVHTLFYSKHPCAALFNGTLPSYSSTDNFPFAAFAAEALELDVAEKVKELLTPA